MKGGDGGAGQLGCPGRILIIAEDRSQRFWQQARGTLAADEVLVDAELFERPVEPLAPGGVAVAVAQERAIAGRRTTGHDLLPEPAKRLLRDNSNNIRFRVKI